MPVPVDFGPRAHLLPGPEVLPDFLRQSEHRKMVKGAQAVAYLGRHAVIRWYPPTPRAGRPFPRDETGMWDLIDTAQNHLRAVETESKGKLTVPSHRSFVAPSPAGGDTLAVISIIERVRGDKVDNSMSRRNNTGDPRNAKSLYGAARYLNWVVDTNQPTVLADDFLSTQYLMRPRTQPNILVDTDYFMVPTEGAQGLTRCLRDLTTWYADLSKPHRTPPLATEALEIIDTLSARAQNSSPA